MLTNWCRKLNMLDNHLRYDIQRSGADNTDFKKEQNKNISRLFPWSYKKRLPEKYLPWTLINKLHMKMVRKTGLKMSPCGTLERISCQKL